MPHLSTFGLRPRGHAEVVEDQDEDEEIVDARGTARSGSRRSTRGRAASPAHQEDEAAEEERGATSPTLHRLNASLKDSDVGAPVEHAQVEDQEAGDQAA